MFLGLKRFDRIFFTSQIKQNYEQGQQNITLEDSAYPPKLFSVKINILLYVGKQQKTK